MPATGERSVATSIDVPRTPIATAKNGVAPFASPFLDTNTSMDWPCLSTGPIHVPAGIRHRHVDIWGEPVAAGDVATGPRVADDDQRERLYPAIQREVVDLDASLDQKLLKFPMRQSVPQVPAHGEEDDVGWELESGQCWRRRLNGKVGTGRFFPADSSRCTLWTIPTPARHVTLNETRPT
jgi:hypothetical protein